MRVLSIRNPDLSGYERSYLTSAYSSGTTLSVINTFALAANDFIVVGEPGQEKAESKRIDSITNDTSLNLASALKFSHPKDTVIVKTHWDQIEISSRVNAGAWSVLSTSGIQWDKPYTVYVHSGGDDTYDYRWRFYNSTLATYSEYSPTYAGEGFTRNQAGYMVQMIRKITRTEGNEEVITDREIYRKINEAHDVIGNIRPDWWFLKFEDSTITTTASTYIYNLDTLGGGTAGTPSDSYTLGYIDKVRYRYNDGSTDTTYPLKFRSENEFDLYITDNNRQKDDYVNLYTLKPADSTSVNGYMWVYPTPNTTSRGTFYVRGYRKFTTINDDIDKTAVPIPEIIEHYVIAHIERIRGNDAKADYYEDLFYGPPPATETRRKLTGIALLEQVQNQSRAEGQPKMLWRFRGQKALSRFFGNRRINNYRDYLHENFWE